MNCPNCQHGNLSKAKFCSECGSSLPGKCSACGHELSGNEKFCPNCGHATSGGESPGEEKQNRDELYSQDALNINDEKPTSGASQIILEKGETLSNRYQIKELLGQGTYGRVYAAEDVLTSEPIALKIIPYLDKNSIKNIILEYKSRNRITDFRHIIHAYNPEPHVIKGQDVILYPMELAGKNFRQWLNETKDELEERLQEGLELFKQACLGLQAIHHAGLIHLDLKPENILLIKNKGKKQDKTQWTVKIADFGLARGIGRQDIELLKDGIGTPAYMAPEQILAARWKDVGKEADIYALGMILYEILDGDLPYSGTAQQIKEKKRDPLVEISPPASFPVLAETAMECLKHKKTHRPESIGEILAELQDNIEREFEERAKRAKAADLLKQAKTHDSKGEINKAFSLLKEAKALDSRNKTIERWLKKVNEKVEIEQEKKRKAEEEAKKKKEEEECKKAEEKRRKAEQEKKKAAARKKAEQEKLLNHAGEMLYVEGGTFLMGGNDEDAYSDEKPVHEVALDSFYIGKYPLTQRYWKAVMGNNPSYFKGCDDCPVERVSWYDAQDFLKKINQLSGKAFRLPTEAEWEYAARGGNRSRGYKYAGSNNLGEVGWYRANSNDKTHPVGQKKPNELGIYDMSGNVWEWCNDWYNRDYYKSSPGRNPQGPANGSRRVIRGGLWIADTRGCRVARRISGSPDCSDYDIGFRLALSSD